MTNPPAGTDGGLARPARAVPIGSGKCADAATTHGARALAAYLQESGWTDCALIFGAMRDKSVPEMLAALAPVCRAICCTTADSPRALPAGAIAGMAALASASWTVTAIADPREAIDTVTPRFHRVVVAGSIFLTGPVRGILRPR